ncbi:MAG: S-adenosylmethionine:tRNA ribosyltransferase-isomerase [Salinivirgaceae bacterium]|nr:S-adenosylmethionine:tRNA ribosyltransferase-isomerase [Salinivirgaceae bacterium]
MIVPSDLSISDFNYPLPDERIAKYPLAERDQSKLLVYNNGYISEDVFRNLAAYLDSDSVIVTNNTKVIRARMEFFKDSGARIEVFCLEPHEPAEYSSMFSQTGSCVWLCYVGNSKKWKSGPLTKQIGNGEKSAILSISRVGTDRDAQLIRFEWDNPNVAFGEIVDWAGQIPIPPYLNRKSEAIDDVRYQTIYSAEKGSVAAPTAGLHFTQAVFDSLQVKGIEHLNVTLHVGAGTFKPVQTETIGEHPMHIEHFVLSDEILKPLCDNKKKVVAVGTTTVRTLESMYWMGVKAKLGLERPLDLGQWEAYSLPDTVSVADAFAALLDLLHHSGHEELTASTCIMIAPGYQYKVVDNLITNFHQPQSTLLLLVSALIGDNWHRVYDYALAHDFRFLSYGDSCLLKVK